MKKLLWLSTAVFLSLTVARGQTNLVPNPSFEDTVQCPTSISQLSKAVGWYSPTYGTTDYFNSCNGVNYNYVVGVPQNLIGWENAKTGVAYAGFCFHAMSSSGEYLQAQLTDTLIAGYKYYVSFYVSLADSVNYACNTMGAYFSQTAVITTTPWILPFTPQITNPSTNALTNKNGWTLVTDTFTAAGGELYITIGNFNNAANSDTVFVGGGLSSFTDLYYYFIDDISVWTKDSLVGVNEKKNFVSFSITPNPFSTQTTLHSDNLLHNATLTVYNSYGQQVKQIDNLSGQTIVFHRDNLPSGLYFIALTTSSPSLLLKEKGERVEVIATEKLIITDN